MLTLKNLNVKNSEATEGTSGSYYGIYVDGKDDPGVAQSDTLIIVLEGENTVSSGYNASSHSNAISLLELDITIKGSGKLTATGGTTEKGISKGVNIQRELKMTGGSVTCKGGTAGKHYSYGMHLDTLTVSGGTLICEGGNGSCSYGVQSNGITVSDGTMEGKGGTANVTDTTTECKSYGVLSDTHITVGDGSIKGTGGEAKTDSYGVHARTAITVNSGGSITGTGGTATGNSYGVGASDDITVKSGGYLQGTASTGVNGSYGVYTEKQSITLGNGATTLAQGHNQALSKAPINTVAAVASVNYDGTGAVTYVSTNNNTYRYFRMPEAIPATQITVTQDSFPYGQAPENEKVMVTSNDAIFNFNASNSFDSASMDRRPIDLGSVGAPGAHGSVRNGSIVIHLNKAYLNTLPVGTHTLLVNLAGIFAGQTVRTSITVLPSGDGTGGAGDVPQTGDSATPVLWLGIALLASAGLFVSAVRRRKRQNG